MMNKEIKRFLASFLLLSTVFSVPYFLYSFQGLLFSLALLYVSSFGLLIFITMSQKSKDSWKKWGIAGVVAIPFILMDILPLLIGSEIFQYREYTESAISFGVFIAVGIYFAMVSFLFGKQGRDF